LLPTTTVAVEVLFRTPMFVDPSPLPSAANTSNSPASLLLDRDHSILWFNNRVLSRAQDNDVPLLERLRYLCIVSSNLDEFFEVRAAPHVTAAQQDDHKGLYTLESFKAISAAAYDLVERQYRCFNHDLMPAIAKHEIHLVSHADRGRAQRDWVKSYFERQVKPLLVPVALDPAHPFPQVANKSLNFIVQLSGLDAFGRDNDIAIVKVPRVLPRIIQDHSSSKSKSQNFYSLSSVIRAHIAEMFPGRQVGDFSQFRLTRHSDLAVDEDDVKNLRTALRLGLEHRHYGQAVRLEVSAACSPYLSQFLLKQFDLPAECLYRVHGPVNLVRLNQLVDLVDAPALRFVPFKPAWPVSWPHGVSVFDRLAQGDILLHQPFESFEAVLSFLREAVNDPAVLAIKQTIYRTGTESELMVLLREAVRLGKEVTVVVELKARFDEEANINWAEQLESIGAQVVYGVVGLKTHAKMLLVTRKEGRHLRRYAHLSTGNYNPKTAKLYTDVSYITSDPAITADVDNVFWHVASQTKLPRLNKLWMAPFHLHKRLLEKIEQLASSAGKGLDCRIVAKMNALTDDALIHALILAGKQGVKIDLIVRGACMLAPRVPGQTDNIRVRSVVGRFLEHTRVFYFRQAEQVDLYLSSADWMNRNMLRRIELAWPITDANLAQRVIDECLVPYLNDNKDAWDLGSDGKYLPAAGAAPPGQRVGAQDALIQRYQPSNPTDPGLTWT
jgi:polyphosphate kinase